MKYTRVNFQFSLFGWQKPTSKVPISKERVAQAKALYLGGDVKGAARKMHEVAEGLERYLSRMK